MARRRKKAPNKKTPIIQTKEPNNQTLDGKKSGESWWKAAASSWLLLFLLLVQIVFGDGTFWQWRQEDYEKTKHRTELSEKLNSNIAQALQLEREQIEACFRKERRGSEISYQALSDSEKAETGCYQKEYPSMGEAVPLCFLQATMPETVLSFHIWTLFLSA